SHRLQGPCEIPIRDPSPPLQERADFLPFPRRGRGPELPLFEEQIPALVPAGDAQRPLQPVQEDAAEDVWGGRRGQRTAEPVLLCLVRHGDGERLADSREKTTLTGPRRSPVGCPGRRRRRERGPSRLGPARESRSGPREPGNTFAPGNSSSEATSC